jgi:L-threonylcarbamoyladenylate synthase
MLITSDVSLIAKLVLQSKGTVIAYPTETFYGLGAMISDSEAIEKIYTIKQREWAKGVIVLVASMKEAIALAEIGQKEKEVLEDFWPGPLTAVLKAKQGIDPRLLVNGCIALRISSNPYARTLAEELGPITSTSANIAGGDPAKSPNEVIQYNLPIDGLLDGGYTRGKKPSTIVDFTRTPPECIREGEIPFPNITAYFSRPR